MNIQQFVDYVITSNSEQSSSSFIAFISYFCTVLCPVSLISYCCHVVREERDGQQTQHRSEYHTNYKNKIKFQKNPFVDIVKVAMCVTSGINRA
jgi:hypothetical protein